MQKKSKFEAPWYGFYDLAFSPLNCLTATDATLIYPQFPVRFQESVEIEDDNDLPVIPGRYNTPDNHNMQKAEGTSSNAPKEALVSAKEFKKLRSERTPDFCRRRYYLDDKGEIIAARLDLLVEIKKAGDEETRHEAKYRIVHQILTQANYAFGDDPRLSKIICMGAVGPRWFYFLQKRPQSADLMKLLRKNSHPRLAQTDSPYVPSDWGSDPVTPTSEDSEPRKRSKHRKIQQSSLDKTDTSECDSDASLDSVKTGTAPVRPVILEEGIFEDPTSVKEKEWIIKLKRKLDEVDEDIAESYRKQLREEDDQSVNEPGEEEEGEEEEENDLDELGEEVGESDGGIGQEDGELDAGTREEADEWDDSDKSRDEIDFLSKQTSREKQGGGRGRGGKQKDNNEPDDNESEDELNYWGSKRK